MWMTMKNRKKKSSHFSAAMSAAVSDFAKEMSGGSAGKIKPAEVKKGTLAAGDKHGWDVKRA